VQAETCQRGGTMATKNSNYSNMYWTCGSETASVIPDLQNHQYKTQSWKSCRQKTPTCLVD
jgi:hypothetical protein